MTARAAERVSATGSRLVAATLTGVLVGAAPGLVLGAAPAAAGWRASAAVSSGTLDRASVGAAFDVRTPGGGVQRQPSPLAAGALLSGGSGLLDVVSTSTVPVRVDLTLTLGGLGLGQTTVQTCDDAWSATMTCAPTRTRTVATLGGLGGALSSSWSAVLPVDEVQRLKVNSGLGVGATATLTATATPTRAPADRTLG